ncbi:hypothetical protein F2P56_031385, partial [Juglans regia]
MGLLKRRGLQQENQPRELQDIERQGPQKAEVNSEENGKTNKRPQIPEWIVKILHPEQGRFLRIWNVIFVVSCMVAISVDPLFFYVPVVNEEKKCLALDKTLKISAICLRSVTDMIYFVNIILQFLCPYIDEIYRELGETVLVKDAWLIAKRYFAGYFVIDTLAILPFSQVKPQLDISRIYLAWTKLNETTTLFRSSVLVVRAAFNMFLYILASHVLGAFWFFFSVQRQTTCWHVACHNQIGCNPHFFNCDHGFGNYTFLNEYCPVKTPNKTLFDFGIFLEALQSGTVVSTTFTRKILYCFWWGVRNLSSFGGSLQTSPNIWENCFAVLISIFGLLLFLFFVGNVQTYMKSETSKQLETYMDKEDLAKMSGKESSIQLWMERNNLPENQRKVLMSDIQGKLRKKKDIETENLFPHLPILLRMEIKRHLCLPILKKVPMLNKDKALLEWICMYLKPVYYNEHSYIFREGEPIDVMLFITQCIVLKFPTSKSGEPICIECIEQGNFYGVQLLQWSLDHSTSLLSLSKLPISTETLKTHTKVEAFGLMANDLKTLLSKRKTKQPASTTEAAALTIQAAWGAFL